MSLKSVIFGLHSIPPVMDLESLNIRSRSGIERDPSKKIKHLFGFMNSGLKSSLHRMSSNCSVIDRRRWDRGFGRRMSIGRNRISVAYSHGIDGVSRNGLAVIQVM